MGYEQVNRVNDQLQSTAHTYANLWAGWFPGKLHSDIPGDFQKPVTPLGSPDCNNVIYYDGALRKMYGYSAVTSGTLNGTTTSLFYSPLLGRTVATAGTKIYSDLELAAPTDITGSVSILSTNNTHWTEWVFGTQSYLVGVQQGQAPFYWTGSGNAAVLAGTPPQGKWCIRFQNALWIANTSTNPTTIYFSALGDATSWTSPSTFNYVFDAPIVGVGRLGEQLVIFMEDHIGIMSGTDNTQLVKIDRYISGKGCSGGFTICNTVINGQEVLVFHSFDGFYAFDGSQNLQKLSSSISQKYTGTTGTQTWNANLFSKAWAAVDTVRNWYMCALADSGDTNNQTIVIIDLARQMQINRDTFNTLVGSTGYPAIPHWQMKGTDAQTICTVYTGGNHVVYFGSSDSKIHKYDTSLYTKNGAAYTGYFKSKIMDTNDSQIIEEMNVLTDEQGSSTTITATLNMDLSLGDGNVGSSSLTGNDPALDSTFILDSSQLGGHTFLFSNVQVTNYGRFLQFQLKNAESGNKMVVYGVNLITQSLGVEPNVPSS